MTPEQQRIAELEAQRTAALEEENARLRELNQLLTDALELATGIELPKPGQDQRGCRVPPPPRRCRPGGRRLW